MTGRSGLLVNPVRHNRNSSSNHFQTIKDSNMRINFSSVNLTQSPASFNHEPWIEALEAAIARKKDHRAGPRKFRPERESFPYRTSRSGRAF